MANDHDAYAALRHRDYRCLLSGAVLAAFGSQVQTVAVAWELYDRTKSTLLLGLSGFAQFLPILLLALPAGAVADRFNRKRVFQLAQAASASLSLSLVYLSATQRPAWLILVCLLFLGVTRAFSAPARVSLLPQLVPLADLPNAITWNSTGWHVASTCGPVLGGLLVAVAPPTYAYGFAACCAVSCVILLVPILPRETERAAGARSLGELLAGVRFVWRTKLLLAALLLDLFAVLLGGATALLPVFASDILEVGPAGLGWLRAAPAAGALVTAFAIAHTPLRRPGVALLAAVAGFGATTILFGLSTSFALSMVLLAILGAFDNVSVVVRGTLLQILTPNAMRGRVAAVNTVFISSSNELGEFESGLTAHWFGPVAAVVLGGVGTLGIVATVALAFPMILALGPLRDLRPAEAEEESGRSAGQAV